MNTELNVKVEIKPFTVPIFVMVDEAPGFILEDTGIPLSALDSSTLYKLCNDFRDEVFKKAGKEQPPQAR